MNYVIGAGGVGSWLTPALCLLTSPSEVTVLDGDKLEQKNLNRQLFTESDIGRNKADALSEKYGCRAIPEFFSMGKLPLRVGDVLMVCVDNNPARKDALMEADRTDGIKVIVAANERHSSEAYIYYRAWKNTKADPRIYYPEIVTDRSDDPRATAIGCTGEAQVRTPQLVTANFMAAGLAQHLYVLWMISAPKLEADTIPRLPNKLVSNLSKLESFPVGKPEATT